MARRAEYFRGEGNRWLGGDVLRQAPCVLFCFVLFCFDMLTGDCEVCGDEWVYFAAWWEAEAHG